MILSFRCRLMIACWCRSMFVFGFWFTWLCWWCCCVVFSTLCFSFVFYILESIFVCLCFRLPLCLSLSLSLSLCLPISQQKTFFSKTTKPNLNIITLFPTVSKRKQFPNRKQSKQNILPVRVHGSGCPYCKPHKSTTITVIKQVHK